VHSDVSSANFSCANLREADLTDSDLTGALLTGANLENADLRGAKGVRLDDNYVRGAKFSSNATDPWSILRRSYTGHRFGFHMLVLALFMAPYLARAIFWAGVNEAQVGMIQMVARLKSAALDLEASALDNGRVLSELVSRMGEVQPCLREVCREWPIWQILLGADKGWAFFALAAALVLYNLLRGILTWRVGPLRDEEERSGYSPTWRAYSHLVWLHRGVSLLLAIAVISFLWHASRWLSASVWLPA